MGYWVGMGLGVDRVCFPTVAPLTPLHVLLVYTPPHPPTPPPSGVFRMGWDWGSPPLCEDVCQGSPHIGDGVRGLRTKFCQGLPPRGGIVRVWGHP